MSVKERDWLKVLHEVKQGHMTQRAGGVQLGVTDRWVRKLLVRMKKEGDEGIVHRLRGRESNRRLGESVRGKVLKLMKAKYHDFGPTLACEYLARDDGVTISKETLRQLLIGAGLRRVKRRRVEEVHEWRPRRSCRGELVQWDTSLHDWLEGRGPRMYLVLMIDDATSRAYGRLAEVLQKPLQEAGTHVRELKGVQTGVVANSLQPEFHERCFHARPATGDPFIQEAAAMAPALIFEWRARTVESGENSGTSFPPFPLRLIKQTTGPGTSGIECWRPSFPPAIRLLTRRKEF